jgi:hypothetical protein
VWQLYSGVLIPEHTLRYAHTYINSRHTHTSAHVCTACAAKYLHQSIAMLRGRTRQHAHVIALFLSPTSTPTPAATGQLFVATISRHHTLTTACASVRMCACVCAYAARIYFHVCVHAHVRAECVRSRAFACVHACVRGCMSMMCQLP